MMAVKPRPDSADLVRTTRLQGEEPAEELLLADLLNDGFTLARLMVSEVRHGRWLDSYLLAAGLDQVAEDWLHRDVYSLRKVAGLVSRAGRTGQLAALPILTVRRLLVFLRRLRAAERRATAWRRELADLVDRLGALVARERASASGVREQADSIASRLHTLPHGLASSILKLPSCFRSLDQRPEDCEELSRLFASRWPDRNRSLLVIGVRTSGSYLAPLHAAYLRGLGYHAQVLTVRPGQDLLPADRAVTRAAARAGALVLICDDPPTSGTAVAALTDQLNAAGLAKRDMVIVLALLAELPERLLPYQAVTLPPQHWHIQASLEPSAVGIALGAQDVERLDLDSGRDLKTSLGQRRHVRARYRVRWPNGRERIIYAKGIGLGYFGRHTLVVSRTLEEYIPETFTVTDGVLFREWLPERCRQGTPLPALAPQLAERIATYVATRGRRLPATADRSLLLAGRHPLWQRIADRLARGFRRARPLVRPALHRLARRLLTSPRPSVVDGSLALAEWFYSPDRRDWLKVDFDERAFSNEDLHVYDAAWDLAVAAGDAEMEGAKSLSGLLRRSFEQQSGQPIEEARWLLYRLQHLAGHAETMRELLVAGGPERDRAFASREAALAAAEHAMTAYIGDRLLGELAPPPVGRLCAIDIDGVLETSWLGFSSITPAGALAIRTLLCHGFRPVLATGRSLAEVTARCQALKLAGGVAEYGTVIYDARDASRIELLDPEQLNLLERVRLELERIPGVRLDPRWERTVRAFQLGADGRRRSLPVELVDATLSRFQGSLQAVPGWAQTDFVPANADKGRGLTALSALISSGRSNHDRLLALAVGDTETDLPMLALAERPWAPANGRAALRAAGVRFARRRFQAGLAEAVSGLVGHEAGGCPLCRPPQQAESDRLLLQALAAQDAGLWGRLSIALRLYRSSTR